MRDGLYQNLCEWQTELPSHCMLPSDLLGQYAADRSKGITSLPEVVCCPSNKEDIQHIINVAARYDVPLTVRGAGTGTTGACVPVEGGIVLSLERYNAIVEIDDVNRMAVVQAGVLTADLKEAAVKKGLFYPPDPASVTISTLGGNVACNSGGLSSVKYGVTKDYVVGLSGFYADGSPFSLGGKLYKNVAGYDLLSLLIGSEGTLAVVTEITCKLLPLPTHQASVLVGLDSPQAAVNVMKDVMTHGLLPSAMEYLDRTCIESVLTMPEAKPVHEAWYQANDPAYLLISVDGMTEQSVQQQLANVQPYFESKTLLVKTMTSGEDELLWSLRRQISDALRYNSRGKRSHDVVVPLDRIPDLYEMIQQFNQSSDLNVLGYGHLGDGNIHVNFLCPDDEMNDVVKLEQALMKTVIELGGSVTGEHGVGLTKKAAIRQMYPSETLNLMKKMKVVFDPKGILNPGKIL